MSIRVVTDSLGDIPSDVAQELGIAIIPATLIFGREVYRDRVDLNTDQFYAKLAASKVFPTTSIPPLNEFSDVYDSLAQEAAEILVITVGSSFSGIYNAAVRAVSEMKRKCRIEVMDSRSGCMQEGLLVIAAARAINQGASLDEAIALTRHNMTRIEIRFAFDTLEYLRRGGRIGKIQSFLGSVFKVHPVTTIKDGEAFPVARERSRAAAIDHLCRFALEFSRIEEMAIEDATTPEEAEAIADRLSAKYPRERIYRSKVSPVIGAHVGPHVLGVTVLGDR